MPPFVAPLVILSAACLAVLFVLYRIYETRVDQPKRLEDEVKEALEGARAEVESIEPVRKAAVAISYSANKIVIVRNFGKLPTRKYVIADLIGIEVFVNDKVVARVLRGGPHKMLDDIGPDAQRVTIRLVFDDPSHPDYELVLWDPTDALTPRAEGPRAAMVTARKWFYHVEAIMRRPVPEKAKAAPPPPVAPEPPSATGSDRAKAAASPSADKAVPPKPQGDVMNTPMIPYI